MWILTSLKVHGMVFTSDSQVQIHINPNTMQMCYKHRAVCKQLFYCIWGPVTKKKPVSIQYRCKVLPTLIFSIPYGCGAPEMKAAASMFFFAKCDKIKPSQKQISFHLCVFDQAVQMINSINGSLHVHTLFQYFVSLNG